MNIIVRVDRWELDTLTDWFPVTTLYGGILEWLAHGCRGDCTQFISPRAQRTNITCGTYVFRKWEMRNDCNCFDGHWHWIPIRSLMERIIDNAINLNALCDRNQTNRTCHHSGIRRNKNWRHLDTSSVTSSKTSFKPRFSSKINLRPLKNISPCKVLFWWIILGQST